MVRKSADLGKTLRIQFGKERDKNISKQPYMKAGDTQCNLGIALLKGRKNFSYWPLHSSFSKLIVHCYKIVIRTFGHYDSQLFYYKTNNIHCAT